MGKRNEGEVGKEKRKEQNKNQIENLVKDTEISKRVLKYSRTI